MTTIVLVRKNNEVVVAGDGQVSMGNTVVKSTASKVRKIEKRDVVASNNISFFNFSNFRSSAFNNSISHTNLPVTSNYNFIIFSY